MANTYSLHRGYHYGRCMACGRVERHRIPDNAAPDYCHNPSNPLVGLCGGCNGGVANYRIRQSERLRRSPLPTKERLTWADVLARYVTPRPGPGEHLDWGQFLEIGKRHARRAPEGQFYDCQQEIIVRLALRMLKAEAEGRKLNDFLLNAIAASTVADLWRVTIRRQEREQSLNIAVKVDEEGHEVEAIDLLEAQESGPLDRIVDREVIRAMPPMLVRCGAKRMAGIPLTKREQKAWERYRGQREKGPQLRMF